MDIEEIVAPSAPTSGDVRRLIEAWAPPHLAESWDNVGWQLGHDHAELRAILVALDVDHAVIDEAMAHDANLIVAHHPLLFRGLKRVDPSNYEGRMIKRLLCDEIHVLAAHTNLDRVPDGVNGALAATLGLTPYAPLSAHAGDPTMGFGACCRGEPRTAREMARQVAQALGAPQVRLTVAVEGADRQHTHVALLGGSGASLIDDVLKSDCRLFVTGELKYHEAQGAARAGLSVIEAGHYHSERPVLGRIAERLKGLGTPVYVAESVTSPFASNWESE
ncbi:MAG: Nif3-like dinuclear metal center hexameric protein [Anaerolineales bacterium]|nr:Nif3-like dinuclear metal center hexameric protein [Anaerolineales bacterium]MCB9172916.1 Nif3-like dinuclear metal center hexameric protein [Ardenticatenales bacterium]